MTKEALEKRIRETIMALQTEISQLEEIPTILKFIFTESESAKLLSCLDAMTEQFREHFEDILKEQVDARLLAYFLTATVSVRDLLQTITSQGEMLRHNLSFDTRDEARRAISDKAEDMLDATHELYKKSSYSAPQLLGAAFAVCSIIFTAFTVYVPNVATAIAAALTGILALTFHSMKHPVKDIEKTQRDFTKELHKCSLFRDKNTYVLPQKNDNTPQLRTFRMVMG